MAKDTIQFNRANEYVMDKDKSLSYYIQYMLSRTQSMFNYEGLPDTIPQSKLELMLQTKGYAFVTEVEGKLYALNGSLGGKPDVYDDYTEITVANVALNLTKTYSIENDGILIDNDTMRLGLLPILNKYGALLSENIITMRTIDIVLRMVTMISAGDDRTYNGAEKFISDIERGKISAVAESAFFDGIKVHSVANSQNYIHQFIEYEQYLKASCFNEIGLNANYNMKRENIGSNESALNDDFLLPLVDNMIKCRQTALDKINEKYGTEITIDYASAWKVTHEENEKQIAISESIASQVDNGNDLDISIDEKQGVHDINKPTINIVGGGKDETQSIRSNRHDTDTEHSDGLTESNKEDNSTVPAGNEDEKPERETSDSNDEPDRENEENTDTLSHGTDELHSESENTNNDSSGTETGKEDLESEDKDNDRNKG